MATDETDDEAPAGDPMVPDPMAVAAALQDLGEQRRWVMTIKALVDSKYSEPFENSVVQIAYEDMLTAAFERLERILNSDRPFLGQRGEWTDSAA